MTQLSRRVFPLLLAACACRPHRQELPVDAPLFHGRIVGERYSVQSTGPGGLSQVEVALSGPHKRGLPGIAHIRIDSATRFAVVSASGIDWRIPDIYGTYVRVWSRGGTSNPTNVDFFLTARIVAIDSGAVDGCP